MATDGRWPRQMAFDAQFEARGPNGFQGLLWCGLGYSFGLKVCELIDELPALLKASRSR